MKRIALILLVAVLLLGGCQYTKDGDVDYKPKGEYVLPAPDAEPKGSVPYMVGCLVAKGQVIRDYYQLKSDGIGAEEAYAIRTNGVTAELYRFEEGNVLLEKTKELGAYPIMDDEGNVLATRRAAVNGQVVLMIPASQNIKAEDVTPLHDKLIERFLSIETE